MLCIFAQKLPPLDPTLKIELPAKVQAMFDGMLQAAWWAAAIVAAFDSRPRRRRPLASIAADIAGLSAADRNRLVAAVCAAYLQDHPGFARALSLSIDGDEAEG